MKAVRDSFKFLCRLARRSINWIKRSLLRSRNYSRQLKAKYSKKKLLKIRTHYKKLFARGNFLDATEYGLKYKKYFSSESIEKFRKHALTYVKSEIDPYFKDSNGHLALLNADRFIEISPHLDSYLDNLLSTRAGSWIKASQKNSSYNSDNVSDPDVDEKIRVLFFVRSWGFIEEFIDYLGLDQQFIVDKYDFRIIEDRFNSLYSEDESKFEYRILNQLYSVGPYGVDPKVIWNKALELDGRLSDLVEAADIIFIDWMNMPTVWGSKFLPADKKVIARCHSYEAFTSFPLVTNFSNIDHVVFVAPHIREIVQQMFGKFISLPASSVLGNLRDLKPLLSTDISNVDERRWKVGMMGYAIPVKGFKFALEVIRALRATDNRWQLHLAGASFVEEGVLGKYSKECNRLIVEYDLTDAVFFDGYITDVSLWFQKIGVILSASEREGTHETILEGMASGCVPALRNWPMVKKFSGVKNIYPEWPAFDSPQELANWVVETQPSFGQESIRAREFAGTKDIKILGKKMKDIIIDVHNS
jgi:glycosyltransferase involved in cell wall biosynthesis